MELYPEQKGEGGVKTRAGLGGPGMKRTREFQLQRVNTPIKGGRWGVEGAPKGGHSTFGICHYEKKRGPKMDGNGVKKKEI